MNRIIFLIFSAVLALGAYAQQFTATGVVSSEKDGELLPGVTVRVKGQNVGTATDIDGRFTVNAKQGDVLEFSYIGYKPVSAKAKATPMNIVMTEDQNSLDEVVVVGYATDRKSVV